MNGAVVTVVNLLGPPVPCFAFTEKKNQRTGPQPFSPLPTSSHVGTVQVRPGGPLALSTEAIACKNIPYFRKCFKFLRALGKGSMGSQQKRHLQTFFPTCSFLGSAHKLPMLNADCSPLCVAAQRRRWFARRDAQLSFQLPGLSLFFFSITVRCTAQKRGEAHPRVGGVLLITSLWDFKGRKRIFIWMGQQVEKHCSLRYQEPPPCLAVPSCLPPACGRTVDQSEWEVRTWTPAMRDPSGKECAGSKVRAGALQRHLLQKSSSLPSPAGLAAAERACLQQPRGLGSRSGPLCPLSRRLRARGSVPQRRAAAAWGRTGSRARKSAGAWGRGPGRSSLWGAVPAAASTAKAGDRDAPGLCLQFFVTSVGRNQLTVLWTDPLFQAVTPRTFLPAIVPSLVLCGCLLFSPKKASRHKVSCPWKEQAWWGGKGACALEQRARLRADQLQGSAASACLPWLRDRGAVDGKWQCERSCPRLYGAAGGQCFSISVPTSRPTANRSIVNPLSGELAGKKMISSTTCEPFLFGSHD